MLQNLKLAGMNAARKIKMLLSDEKGEVNIVATVVLIGIAVVLALVFKDAIGNLINTMLATITNNATDAIS